MAKRMAVRTPASASSKLASEVRQSLSLLAITALTLVASIGIGMFAGHIG